MMKVDEKSLIEMTINELGKKYGIHKTYKSNINDRLKMFLDSLKSRVKQIEFYSEGNEPSFSNSKFYGETQSIMDVSFQDELINTLWDYHVDEDQHNELFVQLVLLIREVLKSDTWKEEVELMDLSLFQDEEDDKEEAENGK